MLTETSNVCHKCFLYSLLIVDDKRATVVTDRLRLFLARYPTSSETGLGYRGGERGREKEEQGRPDPENFRPRRTYDLQP